MTDEDDGVLHLTPQQQEAMERSIAELRRKKNASGRPAEGVWYYAWFKPSWKLFVLQGDNRMHVDLWAVIVQDLASRYKLDDVAVDKLESAFDGMPRGRCCLEDGRYVMHHGGDWPSRQSVESQKKRLLGEFSLVPFYLADKSRVEFKHDENYRMEPADQKAIVEVLGDIPY